MHWKCNEQVTVAFKSIALPSNECWRVWDSFFDEMKFFFGTMGHLSPNFWAHFAWCVRSFFSEVFLLLFGKYSNNTTLPFPAPPQMLLSPAIHRSRSPAPTKIWNCKRLRVCVCLLFARICPALVAWSKCASVCVYLYVCIYVHTSSPHACACGGEVFAIFLFFFFGFRFFVHFSPIHTRVYCKYYIYVCVYCILIYIYMYYKYFI